MNLGAIRERLRKTAALMRVGEMGERLAGRDLSVLLARADEVMADIYTFSKTWDMERCRVPFTLPAGAYDWNVVNNDDEEWCFMLNRMDYLEDLALVSLVRGDASYAEKAARLIESWVDAHPSIVPELSTRTLDTGIRIRSMVCVLPALDAMGVLTDELLEKAVRSVRDQIASLRERYLPKYETSNWGSIQTLAVLTVLATLEDDPTSDSDWVWARERAESQMAAQVYPDGIDWEQSTMYHVEVLLYSLRALHVLEAQGAPVPRGLRSAAERLSRALAAQMMPNGCIDAQGDSDRTDVRGLMALCAGVLGDGALAVASGRTRLDASDVFAFGCDVEDALAACAAQAGEALPLTFDGEDSGLFVARSSWGADANLTEFSSGPLGSGHGHSDNLHVTAVYHGAPVLVDGGRYTYREDSPERPYLKGPLAHNVPLLDGRSSCVPEGSWGYSDFGYPLKTYATPTTSRVPSWGMGRCTSWCASSWRWAAASGSARTRPWRKGGTSLSRGSTLIPRRAWRLRMPAAASSARRVSSRLAPPERSRRVRSRFRLTTMRSPTPPSSSRASRLPRRAGFSGGSPRQTCA